MPKVRGDLCRQDSVYATGESESHENSTQGAVDTQLVGRHEYREGSVFEIVDEGAGYEGLRSPGIFEIAGLPISKGENTFVRLHMYFQPVPPLQSHYHVVLVAEGAGNCTRPEMSPINQHWEHQGTQTDAVKIYQKGMQSQGSCQMGL